MIAPADESSTGAEAVVAERTAGARRLSRAADVALEQLAHASKWLTREAPGVIVVVVAFVVYFVMYEFDDNNQPGNSDGFYAWLYARSIAFDHDVDFKNDYAVCGDPFRLGVDRGTGHPDDPYYPGPAAFWAPVLFVLRWLMPLTKALPAAVAGCNGPLAHATVRMGPFVGVVTIGLSYLICRRFVGPASAAAASALFAFTGGIAMYATFLATYSHVYEAVSLALLVWSALRASERPSSIGRWILCGCLGALCSLQRMTNVVFVLLPCVLALSREGERLSSRLTRVAMVVLPSGLSLLVMMALYRYLYGSIGTMPQGRHYLHFAHSHPWLVLFAPWGGLFYTTPAAWLSVIGLGMLLANAETRGLAGSIAVTSLLILLVAGAVLDWHGSGTYGARRLVVLTPFMILGAAVAWDRASGWIFKRRHRIEAALAIAVILPVGITTVAEMWGVRLSKIPLTGAKQAAQYGVGRELFWSWLDDDVGGLFILPAAAIFHWRYGLPAARWYEATQDRWYARDPRSLAWGARELPAADPAAQRLALGFGSSAQGLTFPEGRAAITFAASWPFADRIELDLSSRGRADLQISLATFWKERAVGQVVVASESSGPYALPIPGGTFDSGIVQLAFECRGDCSGVVLKTVRFDDTRALPPAF